MTPQEYATWLAQYTNGTTPLGATGQGQAIVGGNYVQPTDWTALNDYINKALGATGQSPITSLNHANGTHESQANNVGIPGALLTSGQEGRDQGLAIPGLPPGVALARATGTGGWNNGTGDNAANAAPTHAFVYQAPGQTGNWKTAGMPAPDGTIQYKEFYDDSAKQNLKGIISMAAIIAGGAALAGTSAGGAVGTAGVEGTGGASIASEGVGSGLGGYGGYASAAGDFGAAAPGIVAPGTVGAETAAVTGGLGTSLVNGLKSLVPTNLPGALKTASSVASLASLAGGLGGGSSSTPGAPDFTSAALAQGAVNKDATTYTTALNRPTQVTAEGTQSWSLRPGADPNNPQPGDWVVTNTQTPQLAAQTQSYNDMATTALGQAKQNMSQPFTAAGVPNAQYLATPTAQRASIDTKGLTAYGAIPTGSDSSRQSVQDALYARQTAMLDPQYQQQQQDLSVRLANQGLTPGSEAYNREMNNFATQRDNAYASARNDAITGGGAEDTRIFNQGLASSQLADSTRAQQLSEKQTVAGFNNNNIDTTFAQNAAATSTNNATRNQQLAEQLMIRNNPLTEATALRSAAQSNQPTFQPYGQASTPAAAPIYGAAQDQYASSLAQYNAAQAAAANKQKGILDLTKTLWSAQQ